MPRPPAIRFAFGDRFRGRDAVLDARRRRYDAHLNRLPIDWSQPAWLALRGDVLHDSPITLAIDAAAGVVTLAGRNVYRGDREGGRGPEMSLRFLGCESILARDLGDGATYAQSELHAAPGDRFDVRIALRRDDGRLGGIAIRFASLECLSADSPVDARDLPSLSELGAAPTRRLNLGRGR